MTIFAKSESLGHPLCETCYKQEGDDGDATDGTTSDAK